MERMSYLPAKHAEFRVSSHVSARSLTRRWWPWSTWRMVKANAAATPRPPGRPTKKDSLRRGAKYELARTVLGVEPIDWILQRRGGEAGELSFREIASTLSGLMEDAEVRDYVTQETVRAWYRAEMQARDRAEAARKPKASTPRKRAAR